PVGEDDAATGTTLVAAATTPTRNSATNPLAAKQSLDRTLLVPSTLCPAPMMATTGTPMSSLSSVAHGSAEVILLAVMPQAPAARSLIDARDRVFAATSPTQADIARWDAQALGLIDS